MEELKKKKSLSLLEIVELTNSSRDTARRDTIKLSDNNLVVRNYGGISLANSFNKIDPYLDRTNNMWQIKKEIAKNAASLINEGENIYFDVSTSVSAIPQFLSTKRDLSSVTNSIDIADQLLRNTKCKTTMLGGVLNRKTRAASGGSPLLELSKYQIDIAFLSCAGVNEKGIYYAHDEDIAMKTKIKEQSKTIVIVCDHTKVGLSHNFPIYSFDDIDFFVTDKKLPTTLSEKIGTRKILYTKEGKNV